MRLFLGDIFALSLQLVRPHLLATMSASFQTTGERRVDAADGAPYIHKRVDPADHGSYTFEDFLSFYEPVYGRAKTEDYWAQCSPEAPDQAESGPQPLTPTAVLRRAVLLPENDKEAEHAILIPVTPAMTIREFYQEVVERSGRNFKYLSFRRSGELRRLPLGSDSRMVEVTAESELIGAEEPVDDDLEASADLEAPTSGTVLRGRPRSRSLTPLRRRAGCPCPGSADPGTQKTAVKVHGSSLGYGCAWLVCVRCGHPARSRRQDHMISYNIISYNIISCNIA